MSKALLLCHIASATFAISPSDLTKHQHNQTSFYPTEWQKTRQNTVFNNYKSVLFKL